MKLALVFLAIACLVFCQNVSSNRSNNSDPGETQSADDRFCAQWNRMHELLTPKSQSNLVDQGIAFFGGNREIPAHYVLSPSLVPECEQRVKFGRFFWIGVGGVDKYPDSVFITKNSSAVVAALIEIWDAREFSADGVNASKYQLLRHEAIEKEEISKLLSHLLRKKRLNLGLFNSIFERPEKLLLTDIDYLLNNSTLKVDRSERIYLLLLRTHISNQDWAVTELSRYSHDKFLSGHSRIALAKIVKKLKAKDGIDLTDIQELDLPLLDAEEDR